MAEQQASNEVKAQPAVLKATIHITRKATGLVETFEIVGTPAEVKAEASRIPALKKEAT